MKKTASLLIALIFSIGLFLGVAAASSKATVKSGTGVVKSFTTKSLTLNENGKVSTYSITTATKVVQLGSTVNFAETIKKGLMVTYKASGSALTNLDIPAIGSENQGDLKIKATDITVADTDSNIAVPAVDITSTRNQVRVPLGEEEADGFAYANDGNMNTYTGNNDRVSIGAIEIIPESVKAVLDGKELKVLTDPKAEFDPSVIGDEAKLIYNEEYVVWQLQFEKKLYEDETKYTVEDLESRLQLTYKKKTFTITTYEVTDFPFSESVVAELNGKEVPLVRALNRSTYSLFTTNTDGDVIYVNAYYRNLQCRIDSISGNTVKISKMASPSDPNSRALWSDVLTMSENTEIFNAAGEPITAADLKAKDIVKVSVDPYYGYKIAEINLIAVK